MIMDWYVFEHGVRVLAWNRTTGETQVGAPPLWGGESIGSEEKVLARPQFKFGAAEAVRVRLIEFDSVTWMLLDVKVVIQLLNAHNIQGAPG